MRGFCRESDVVSRENGTRYRGRVAGLWIFRNACRPGVDGFDARRLGGSSNRSAIRSMKMREARGRGSAMEAKMANTTRGDLDLGSSLPAMPNFKGFGSRILRIVVVVVIFILLTASTTSIPTGNVGVLTLFGRVTGETLEEGIHLINPLKSVEKLSVQTQSVKESANVPSNEGLILALDTSLLFRLDKTKAAYVFQTVGDNYARRSWSQRCERRYALPRQRIRRTHSIPTRANWCNNRYRTSLRRNSLRAA
jgi:hypothetical protein